MIFRGRTDLPLSDHGLAQAAAIGKYLAAEEISGVFVSPMQRAIQTARPLAELKNLDVQPLEGLIDADFGSWQGKTMPQVQAESPELYKVWQEAPHKVTFPGGENYLDIARRATQALVKLAAELGESGAMLVAHRFINKVIICSLLGIEGSGFWKIKQDTACINCLLFRDGEVVIESINDVSHLRNLRTGREIDF